MSGDVSLSVGKEVTHPLELPGCFVGLSSPPFDIDILDIYQTFANELSVCSMKILVSPHLLVEWYRSH